MLMTRDGKICKSIFYANMACLGANCVFCTFLQILAYLTIFWFWAILASEFEFGASECEIVGQ